MTTPLGSASEILTAWHNDFSQLEVKSWSYGMTVMLLGTVRRFDAETLVVANDGGAFHVNLNEVASVSAANAERVQVQLKSGLEIMISRRPAVI